MQTRPPTSLPGPIESQEPFSSPSLRWCATSDSLIERSHERHVSWPMLNAE